MTEHDDDFDPIPRYTVDLLDVLDTDIKLTEYADEQRRFTQSYWAGMDDAKVRSKAFVAGQRALLNYLQVWQSETERNKDLVDAEPEEDKPTSPFERIFDADGEEHKSVASLHVAGTIADPFYTPDGSDQG